MVHIGSPHVFHPFPLAQLAASLAAGIVACTVVQLPLTIWITFSALATCFAAVAFLSNRPGPATVLVTILALLLGCTLASIEKTRVPANQLKSLLDNTIKPAIAVGAPAEVTGVLERDPEIAPQGLYLNLRLEGVRSRGVEREVSGLLRLLVPASEGGAKAELARLDLRYGARIRVMTQLERSDRFRNPGVSSFTEYLDQKGYDATAFVKSPFLIERLENTRVFVPLVWLYDWRRRLQVEIGSRFSPETAGVLNAALLGNRYGLSRSTAERFRDGGTFHVLVISGLHITFLGGLVFLIARKVTRNKAAQFLLPVTILWAYSLAVGGEPSVVRAALMFTFVLLAPLASRRANSLSALGGAAVALLVWRPSELFNPSFQLTFVSVLAIVVLAWPLVQNAAAIGAWRPTRETPHPPMVSPWLRTFCECLFWSERDWKNELKRTTYSCKLFKSPFAQKLERFHLQPVMRYTFAASVVSIGVQLMLLPFLVVYFHRLSLSALVLNISVSVMMGLVAITSTLALLLAQFSLTVAAPFISLTNSLNWLMVHSVDPFARLGMASIRLPEYSGWASAVYGFYYLPLLAIVVMLARWDPLKLQGSNRLVLRSSRLLKTHSQSGTANSAKNPQSFRHNKPGDLWRAALILQLMAVAVLLFHPFSEAVPDGRLRVDFLDVGQGDSALVTMPDNTTILIDGGGRPNFFQKTGEDDEPFEIDTRGIGEAVVSEYLWWRGLDHVDYIIASHADADHVDGLNDVIRNFAVLAVFVARTPERDAEHIRLVGTLATKEVPLYTIGAGDILRAGGAQVEVLWPLAISNSRALSTNNDSVVVRIRLGDRSVLLTGDVEAPAETALVKLHREPTRTSPSPGLRADVVKVAHHGSKTSSSLNFIAATRACVAIAPVGQTSMFGHPHPEVVSRWQAGGAQVFTTGQQGTVTVSTDGQQLIVETFVK